MVSRHWSDRAYWFALFLASPPSRDMRKGGRSMMDTFAYALGQLLRGRHQGNIVRVTNYAATDILDRRNIYFCLEIQRDR